MITFRNFINEARKNEYIVWGVPKGERDEKIMYTKAKNNNEAKKVVDILKKKYDVTKLRIQVLDLSQELTVNDFKRAMR
jgi:hypothetical protein